MQITRYGVDYQVAPGHEWFWPTFANGTWEPSTFKVFDHFLKHDKNFVDIGAWIGPTTLYAASHAKNVFAFEPDPIAFDSLVKNLALNKKKNVIPYMNAVANGWKGINFGTKTKMGDSMSSEIWGSSGHLQVSAVSFEALILDINPNFIKIDIEGGERTIFDTSRLALAECKPTIHLSLHTPWFPNADDLMVPIMETLELYPFFYDEWLRPIDPREAFDTNKFNSIVATFEKI